MTGHENIFRRLLIAVTGVAAIACCAEAVTNVHESCPATKIKHDAQLPAQLRVAVRTGESGRDVFGFSEIGLRLVNHIADHLGVQVARQKGAYSENPETLTADGVDILPAVFWLPSITNRFVPVEQPIATATIGLSAWKDHKTGFATTDPSEWRSVRVAYVSGVLDTRPDFNVWAKAHRVKAQTFGFDDIVLAQSAVRHGKCDLLLATVSDTPHGFERVAEVRRRLTYVAVRRGEPALHEAVARELRSIRLNERAWYAQAWTEAFGAPPQNGLVRAGVFFEPGCFERGPNGSLRGPVCEAAQRVADSCGWRLDPIHCEYADALAALSQGKLDMVGGVTLSATRQRQMLFSRFPAGRYQNFLYSRRLPPLSADSARAWWQAHVVTGPGEETRSRLEERFARLGVHAAVSSFPTTAAAIAAYESGAADALFAGAYGGAKPGEVVSTFPAVPWYFAVAPGREDLRDAIDDAIVRIQAQSPNPQSVAQEDTGLLSPTGVHDLTDEEKACLEERVASGRPVNVEMSPTVLLWKDWSHVHMRPVGVLASYLLELSRRTGLRFNVLSPANQGVASARFLGGEADLWASYMADVSAVPHGRRSVVAYSCSTVCVVPHGSGVIRPGTTRFAVVETDSLRRDFLDRHGFADGIVFCRNEEECFQAVIDGRADAVISTPRSALFLMRKLSAIDDLELRSEPSLVHSEDIAFDISPKVDPVFASAIEKVLRSVTPSECEQMIRETLCRQMEGSRLSPFQVVIVSFSGVVLVLAALVAVFWLLFFRSRRAAAAARAFGEAKSQFLSTISHEIRTPLNVLVGFADFLSKPNLTDEQVREYTDGIRVSSKVLLSLINDVLDLSKLEAGKMDVSGVCRLSDIFEELKIMFSEQAHKKGLSFEAGLQPGLPVVGFSAQRVRQILVNLISNAVKYTEKGNVCVSGSGVLDKTGEHLDLTFRVSDTGIGISPERARAVFSPFEQDLTLRGGNVFEGTGLGLAIVQRLVAAGGGTVTLDSRVGVGSIFTVHFPSVKIVKDAPAAGKPGERWKKDADDGKDGVQQSADVGAGLSVLVVDDIPLNLRIFSIYLKKLGVTDVRTAANGLVALEMTRERMPDVVFTDMWMPEMDGAALATALRKAQGRRELHIVAVTADADTATTKKCDVFDIVMIKPVTEKKIARAFREIRGGGGNLAETPSHAHIAIA